MLVLKFWVRARVRVKVRARVRDFWGMKHLGTKRLGYEMSGSHAMKLTVCSIPRGPATSNTSR